MPVNADNEPLVVEGTGTTARIGAFGEEGEARLLP